MAIFSVIDTSASGDYFDDGMVKDAANWAIVEAALSAATTTILKGGGAGIVPVMTTVTGTGAPVCATSPTLVTPLLGTPTSGILTNCTGLPVAGGGTGAATLADGGLVCGNGTGVVEVVAPGAITTMLVGGGAATAPVWTTATGSGSPVRATSPALVTPTVDHIGEVTGGHGVNIDGVTLIDGGALIITGGTNTFNLTNGTASLDVAAGVTLNVDSSLAITGATNTFNLANGTASLDIAAGITLNVDDNCTFTKGLTVTTNAGTLAFSAASKTLTVANTLALAGTDSTTMTFPPASASVGYLSVPQNSKSAAYEFVLADAGKHILHPSADTTARIFTIPANASVAFPVGTTITIINQDSAGTITIAITTDTMRLASSGLTGSRTLLENGIATAIKVTTTEWIISGVALA